MMRNGDYNGVFPDDWDVSVVERKVVEMGETLQSKGPMFLR